MSLADDLLTRLQQAQSAYHDLLLGQNLAEARHGIEMMRFSQANIASLAAYISDLASQLRQLGVVVQGVPRRGRARAILH